VEVIEMDQVNDGDHPHTLRTMENLADTYRELGCLDETEALEAVVEEKRKRDDGSWRRKLLETERSRLLSTNFNTDHWQLFVGYEAHRLKRLSFKTCRMQEPENICISSFRCLVDGRLMSTQCTLSLKSMATTILAPDSALIR